MKKELTSILVKPAGPDCNLGCTYCFYSGKSDMFPETKKHRMSDEILDNMIRQLLEQSRGQVSIGWQGGEPTLMGLPFYKKAAELMMRYGRGQTVGNAMQTNGMLIDKHWAAFLKDYQFLVGLSIDGPRHVHNHYRRMKDGGESWSIVSDRAKLMLDTGVSVNALTVINDYSVRFPEEIYSFHKELGLTHMQFIPCVETDPYDPVKAASFSVAPGDYSLFLCTLFDLWISDFINHVPSTSIRFFDSIFYSYVDRVPPDCTLLDQCGVYVVVEHNGNVYACDFFVEPEWKLGNIQHDRLIDMLNSKKQTEFGSQKALLPAACNTCQWLKYCYGGCPKDRLRNPRDQNASHFCKAYQTFFNHADPKLRELAESWKQNQLSDADQNRPWGNQLSPKQKMGRNKPCPCGSGLKYKKCCLNRNN